MGKSVSIVSSSRKEMRICQLPVGELEAAPCLPSDVTEARYRLNCYMEYRKTKPGISNDCQATANYVAFGNSFSNFDGWLGRSGYSVGKYAISAPISAEKSFIRNLIENQKKTVLLSYKLSIFAMNSLNITDVDKHVLFSSFGMIFGIYVKTNSLSNGYNFDTLDQTENILNTQFKKYQSIVDCWMYQTIEYAYVAPYLDYSKKTTLSPLKLEL